MGICFKFIRCTFHNIIIIFPSWLLQVGLSWVYLFQFNGVNCHKLLYTFESLDGYTFDRVEFPFSTCSCNISYNSFSESQTLHFHSAGRLLDNGGIFVAAHKPSHYAAYLWQHINLHIMRPSFHVCKSRLIYDCRPDVHVSRREILVNHFAYDVCWLVMLSTPHLHALCSHVRPYI